MLLSSHLQSKFRQALDLEQRSPLPFERHCDAYFGLVGCTSSLPTRLVGWTSHA